MARVSSGYACTRTVPFTEWRRGGGSAGSPGADGDRAPGDPWPGPAPRVYTEARQGRADPQDEGEADFGRRPRTAVGKGREKPRGQRRGGRRPLRDPSPRQRCEQPAPHGDARTIRRSCIHGPLGGLAAPPAATCSRSNPYDRCGRCSRTRPSWSPREHLFESHRSPACRPRARVIVALLESHLKPDSARAIQTEQMMGCYTASHFLDCQGNAVLS